MTKTNKELKITLLSFSYKRGIPYDNSGNGGGFVFDCRGIPNPGRIDIFKNKTGNDKEVIEFIEKVPLAKEFLEGILKVITINIENFIERGFSHLSIAFGCTGGQHRSVYFANKTAEYIRNKYPQVDIFLRHLEL